MARKTTINQVRIELKAIQTAHENLNEFYWGDFLRAIKRKEVRYPLLCCYKVNGTMLRNTSPLNLIIIVADRVYKGHENLDDTESDTHQVLRDIKTIITRSERWNALGAVEIIGNVEGFIDRSADEVTGHILRVTLKAVDTDDICHLPLSGYDFGEQYESVDAPAIVVNSDQTFMQAIAAGGFYELPDIQVTDSDGIVIELPAQTDFVCTPQVVCQPVTYQNSNATYSGSVAAGGNLDIPDETVNIYVDGVLEATGQRPPLSNEDVTINLSF